MQTCEEPSKILLVDDDPSIVTTFRFCLETAGHHVATAATFSQARELAASTRFDVCFLDICLGEASGLDLIPYLRQMTPMIKIVVVTAQQPLEGENDAIQAGANEYVVKPCSPEDLRRAAKK